MAIICFYHFLYPEPLLPKSVKVLHVKLESGKFLIFFFIFLLKGLWVKLLKELYL